MRFKKIGIVSLGTSLLLGSLQLQAATQYKIEDIGKIPAVAAKAVNINNNGDYTISLQNELGGVSAYLVSNGIRQEIGFSSSVTVNALNNNKQATGSYIADEIANKRSAFLYSNANFTNIETMDVSSSTGFDINDSGVSVGKAVLHYRDRRSSTDIAFIHDSQLAEMTSLKDYIRPFLPPQSPYICDFECWEFSSATAINNQGMITGLAYPVGTADDFPSSFLGKLRAFLFDGQTLISLGTLGGDMSFGQAINDNGNVAGVSDRVHETFSSPFPSDPELITEPALPEPDPLHVFFYDGKSMKDLGTLSGGTWAEVEALNNSDNIVGMVVVDGIENAFISSARGLINLNDVLPGDSEWTKLNRATDINDSGVIVGYGQINGEIHGFKLTPVERSEIACIHVSTEICTKILSKTQ